VGVGVGGGEGAGVPQQGCEQEGGQHIYGLSHLIAMST
jgi:hypothetical protein